MSIYLGSQAVTLYLGAVEVASPGGAYLDGLQVFPTGPTVPGAPTITLVFTGAYVGFVAPSDGGSPISGYNIYADGTLLASNQQPLATNQLPSPEGLGSGELVEISAVNAVGEGPKSAAVTST
jgi:hypothetical protein